MRLPHKIKIKDNGQDYWLSRLPKGYDQKDERTTIYVKAVVYPSDPILKMETIMKNIPKLTDDEMLLLAEHIAKHHLSSGQVNDLAQYIEDYVNKS